MERSEIKLFQEIINTGGVKEERFLCSSCLSLRGARAYLFSADTFSTGAGVGGEEMGTDGGMIGRLEFHQTLFSSIISVSEASWRRNAKV